jgi:hypothetical protein
MIRARQGASSCATRVPIRPSDEADGLAGESVGGAAADVIGEVVRGAPFPGAHVGVALGDFLQQRQHEGNGGFGDAEAVGFGRRVADHDAELGRGFRVHVIDADGVLGDDAQSLRGLHDPPADRGVAHGRAHERDRVARRLDDGVFVDGAWQLPGAVAEDELAAHAFKRVDGLRRLLARGKDQDFRLRHCGSVVGLPGDRSFRAE